MDEYSVIKIEKKNHIAWLTLIRPDKRNSMNPTFFKEMLDVFPKLDKDIKVRVVVIKAEGKSFTAGLDLLESAGEAESNNAAGRERFRLKIMELQESFNVIEKCRKPVIAAVHSHCIGGGIDLLSACDIRIASKDAVFSIRETKMAIIADLGTLQRLPHIIGQGHFRELVLTGRNFSAEEALNIGFITHMVNDKDELIAKAKELADGIAKLSPLAVQGSKEIINYSRDNGVYPSLEYVAQKNAAALLNEDVIEAFTAFTQKRDPVFKGE